MTAWIFLACIAAVVVAVAVRVRRIRRSTLRFSLMGEWPCHICHSWRRDARISVRSFAIRGLPDVIRNVRHCNDRQECIDGAAALARSAK